MKASHIMELEEAQKNLAEHIPVDVRLGLHEKICAIRYNVIDGRLSRMEKIILGFGTSLLGGMAFVIWSLVKVKLGG